MLWTVESEFSDPESLRIKEMVKDVCLVGILMGDGFVRGRVICDAGITWEEARI